MFFQVGDFHMNIGSCTKILKHDLIHLFPDLIKSRRLGPAMMGGIRIRKKHSRVWRVVGILWMMFAPNMYSTFIDLKLSVLGKLLGILFLLLQESRFALMARVKRARTQ